MQKKYNKSEIVYPLQIPSKDIVLAFILNNMVLKRQVTFWKHHGSN